jgi:hypothetical protein
MTTERTKNYIVAHLLAPVVLVNLELTLAFG